MWPWKWSVHKSDISLACLERFSCLFFLFQPKEFLFFWKFYGYYVLQISCLAPTYILHSLEAIPWSSTNRCYLQNPQWFHVLLCGSNAGISQDSYWITEPPVRPQQKLIRSMKLINVRLRLHQKVTGRGL